MEISPTALESPSICVSDVKEVLIGLPLIALSVFLRSFVKSRLILLSTLYVMMLEDTIANTNNKING